MASVWDSNVPVQGVRKADPWADGRADALKRQYGGNTGGWTYDNTFGFWRNASKPGQYIQTEQLGKILDNQKNALSRMNAGSYNPGVDYNAAVNPYLSQLNNQLSTAAQQVGSGPAAVNMSNEYETRLRQLLENPDSIQDTGAYKFQFNQGQQAIERSAAAKGMSGSGNLLAELSKYGQGMASQAYGAEADRLANLSGQQKNYLLGLRSAATNDYTAKANALQSLTSGAGTAGQLALEAAKAKSGDYWNAQNMAAQAARDNGYYTKQAIW